jgi:hypothetical protein
MTKSTGLVRLLVSSSLLFSLLLMLLVGNNKNVEAVKAAAFQVPSSPTSLSTPARSLARQGQLPLAASSYSSFEDNNNNNNGNNNNNNRQGSSRNRNGNGNGNSYHNAAAEHDSIFSFEGKRSIESRLNRLEQTAAATLQGFYEPHLHSFSIKPGSSSVRI